MLQSSFLLHGQSIEKKFSGWWAMTCWTQEFHEDNTYEFYSSGHAGNLSQKGNYKISGDTIILNKDSTWEYVSLYLLNGDSLLIDLETFYDYKLVAEKGIQVYNSKKRYDILKNPDMDSKVVISKHQFDSIVNAHIFQLANKESLTLNPNEVVETIRIINTLTTSRDSSYKYGIYSDFMKLIDERNYVNEISAYFD